MKQYIAEREEALKQKILPQSKKEDFEAFWQQSVEHLRSVPVEIRRKKLETPYDKTFTTYEISFNTHDNTWVDAYFSCPNNRTGKLPCVAWFHGGSMKKLIHPDILATGVCCFAIDVRSQGGTTVDKADYSVVYNNGLMTQGVLDKNEFYMRNIYLDAVRTMDVIAQLEEVDPDRIVTYGGSQGGALSIAASALSGRSSRCFTFVTSYCCLKRRTELGSRIFGSTHEFLKVYPQYTDTVFDTLTYFDVINMVSLLKVPTSFCMCLSDPVCLPEFVYSAYAHTPAQKEIQIYPFIEHTQPEAYKQYVLGEFAKL